MYKREVFEEFTNVLSLMSGSECNYIDISNNLISLGFGKTITLEDESFGTLQNASDYVLQIFCLWRIVSPIHVIGCYIRSRDHNGFMRKTLSKLVNKEIQQVEVIRPALDLKITFSENQILEILCGGMGDSELNYRLLTILSAFKQHTEAGYDVLENGILQYVPSIEL